MYYDKRKKTAFPDILVEKDYLLFKEPVYNYLYDLC